MSWITIGIIAAIVVFVGILIGAGYVKSPPDKAFIISGPHKKTRMLIGKAGVKIPFVERMDKLDLSLIPIDVKTSSSVPTADYINIIAIIIFVKSTRKLSRIQNNLAISAFCGYIIQVSTI